MVILEDITEDANHHGILTQEILIPAQVTLTRETHMQGDTTLTEVGLPATTIGPDLCLHMEDNTTELTPTETAD